MIVATLEGFFCRMKSAGARAQSRSRKSPTLDSRSTAPGNEIVARISAEPRGSSLDTSCINDVENRFDEGRVLDAAVMISLEACQRPLLRCRSSVLPRINQCRSAPLAQALSIACSPPDSTEITVDAPLIVTHYVQLLLV